MTDIRMLVSWGLANGLPEDRMSNTLYFATPEITGPDYQSLANDLRAIYAARSWCSGTKLEVRAYNMSDDKPRPERAYATTNVTGTVRDGPGQVALCLSYYSDRNLPQQRGRIYCGPWATPQLRPSAANQAELITLANALAGLGGLDVDWSVFSPTKAQRGEDPTMSISDVWVDNSWDIQRRRQLKSTSRVTAEVNE